MMNEICWNFLSSACCQILKVDTLSDALDPNDQHKPTGYLLLKCCTAYLHMGHLHRDENGLSGHEDCYADTHNAFSSLHLYNSSPVKVNSCHIASLQLSRQDLKKEGLWALIPPVNVSNRCAAFYVLTRAMNSTTYFSCNSKYFYSFFCFTYFSVYVCVLHCRMLPWLRPPKNTLQNQKVRTNIFVHNYPLYEENWIYIQLLLKVRP